MPVDERFTIKMPHSARLLPVGPQAGSEARAEAFAALYDQQFGRVHAFLRYRLDDAQLAEDLAAEVFARAWAKLRDPRRLDSAIAWLFTTARNLVADHYRSRRPTLPLDQAPPLLAADPPEAHLLAGERRALAIQSLAALGEREREIIGLRFVAGLRNRQIAQVLGTSEGNVAKIIHRALARVRAHLRGEGYDV